MYRLYRHILLYAVAFFASVNATGAVSQEVRDSLWRELVHSDNPNDSIRTLYDLYDVSPRSVRGDVGMLLYDVASRTGDVDVQLDIIRNNTNLYLNNDSILAKYEKMVAKLPDSDDKEETLIFVGVNRLSHAYRTASEEKREEMLSRLIKSCQRRNNSDFYGNIRSLYDVCVCLGISSQDDMYEEYMRKLGDLIAQLSKGDTHALRSMYLTQRAIIDTYNGKFEHAVSADKELLGEIELLKEKYRKRKRKFRNYDVNEYLCYSRILANFPALTPAEVEKYYAKVLEIAGRNDDVKADLERTRKATIAYLMAKKDYDGALPLLKEQVPLESNRYNMRRYLRYLYEAAENTGDTATLIYANKAYIKEMEEYMRHQAASKYKELQAVYDMDALKADKAKLVMEQQSAQHRMYIRILVASLIALIVLGVLVIVLTRMYRRARKLTVSLSQSQSDLQKEKKNLLETQEELIAARDEAEKASRTQVQFIQNMRHEILSPLNAITGFSQLIVDSVPEKSRREMERYMEIISVNSELLRALVSDVLDISMMENGEIKLSRQLVSLDQLCEVCVSNVAGKVKPGVELSFKSVVEDDFMMITDPVRVEQVLINFLTNAVKYTDSGSIILSYEIDKPGKNVMFSVTDTGIGIPEGKEEVIFERFEKLSRYQQGAGLGLHICRFVAGMLGGTVKVDTSYKKGARFLFILPV